MRAGLFHVALVRWIGLLITPGSWQPLIPGDFVGGDDRVLAAVRISLPCMEMRF